MTHLTDPVVTPLAGSTAPGPAAPPVSMWPLRRTFVVAESVLAAAGLAGVGQLLSGTFVPPVDVLAPLGLDSWLLPAGWLFATVVAPSAVAAWLALRRAPAAPAWVMAAAGTLALELVVQIPIVGFSPLQPVLGAVALGLAALGWKAHRLGWRTPGSGGAHGRP